VVVPTHLTKTLESPARWVMLTASRPTWNGLPSNGSVSRRKGRFRLVAAAAYRRKG